MAERRKDRCDAERGDESHRVTTSHPLHERSYRALGLLYPRSFRRDFGTDMVRLFSDDVHERGALRAWVRVLSDLVVSVPVQHVEVSMANRSGARMAQAAFAAACIVVLAAFALGRYVVLIVPLFAVAAASALFSWRSRLPYREAAADASGWWWQLIALGAAVLGGGAVAATFGPDMDWFPWQLAVPLYLLGWASMIIGGLLGLVHLTHRFRRRPAMPS